MMGKMRLKKGGWAISRCSGCMAYADKRGEETLVVAGVEPEFWGYWAVVEKGIYYLEITAEPAIAFFDFTSR